MILYRIRNVISVTLAPILGNDRIKLVGEGVVLEHTGGLEPRPLYVQIKVSINSGEEHLHEALGFRQRQFSQLDHARALVNYFTTTPRVAANVSVENPYRRLFQIGNGPLLRQTRLALAPQSLCIMAQPLQRPAAIGERPALRYVSEEVHLCPVTNGWQSTAAQRR